MGFPNVLSHTQWTSNINNVYMNERMSEDNEWTIGWMNGTSDIMRRDWSAPLYVWWRCGASATRNAHCMEGCCQWAATRQILTLSKQQRLWKRVTMVSGRMVLTSGWIQQQHQRMVRVSHKGVTIETLNILTCMIGIHQVSESVATPHCVDPYGAVAWWSWSPCCMLVNDAMTMNTIGQLGMDRWLSHNMRKRNEE